MLQTLQADNNMTVKQILNLYWWYLWNCYLYICTAFRSIIYDHARMHKYFNNAQLKIYNGANSPDSFLTPSIL